MVDSEVVDVVDCNGTSSALEFLVRELLRLVPAREISNAPTREFVEPSDRIELLAPVPFHDGLLLLTLAMRPGPSPALEDMVWILRVAFAAAFASASAFTKPFTSGESAIRAASSDVSSEALSEEANAELKEMRPEALILKRQSFHMSLPQGRFL